MINNPQFYIPLAIIVYLLSLLAISRLTSRKTTNNVFFRGEKKSPWYLVAFGMIGASISGVTFVSVPGMVITQDMTYLQTCIGFIFGYLAVAFILLPIYYSNDLTTIYSLLQKRIGRSSYLTGTSFFLLSKMAGASIRFYIVCIIMQRFFLDSLGVPFIVTVIGLLTMIWIYTRRSGIKTLVWTDTLQTAVMFAALLVITIAACSQLGMTLPEAISAVAADKHSHIFEFSDFVSRQNFWKQFVSGIFIVIVMTGLDQDMMQKNLTCRSLKDAQKDLVSYGLAFVPANLAFMFLGVLLLFLCNNNGMAIPADTDQLMPMFCATGTLGTTASILFAIGLIASSFSSADSAITSMTTCLCVDICNKKDDERFRRIAHIIIVAVFITSVILIKYVGSTNVLNTIYTLCGYTYGPLLGLFAYAIIVRRPVIGRLVPVICIASPLLCWIIDTATTQYYGYKFGYELLLLNGLLVLTAMIAISKRKAIIQR